MKRTYQIAALLAVIILTGACTVDKIDQDIVHKEQESGNNVLNPCSVPVELTKFHGSFGKYTNLLAKTDVTMGISSNRMDIKDGKRILAFFDPGTDNATKAGTQQIQSGDFLINGERVFSPDTKSQKGKIRDLFGSTVSFGIPNVGVETKSDDYIIMDEYVPGDIEIVFPCLSEDDRLPPLCYYENFVVKWNADFQNDNGVIILVKWTGTMVFGNDYTSSYIYHVENFPDTGSAELDPSMFEGIPDTAYCRLYLCRGNFEDVETGTITYRMLAESHDAMNFVLVRNIVEE